MIDVTADPRQKWLARVAMLVFVVDELRFKGLPRNKLSKETNHRDTENTERGEKERVFGSVLGHFFIWKSPTPR
ncbi:hypothetical protein A6V25_04170 [Nostoc sp. ATCC 53789]|jgi:hypothetical protein|nr:hypothetical protein A6V25_04170 [Nostoc sp. ATCC 53789]